MTRTISRESTQNREYVRRLLDQKRPEFSAALGLALVLAELEEWPPSVSLNRRCQGPEAQPASAPNDRRSGFVPCECGGIRSPAGASIVNTPNWPSVSEDCSTDVCST
jgi:hypothetical protein